MKKFEKFKRPFRVKTLEVAKLPSFGSSNVGIAIPYPYRERPNNSHMFQPS